MQIYYFYDKIGINGIKNKEKKYINKKIWK